jgi:hypothetical protein
MAYLLTNMLRLVRDELMDAGEAAYTDAEISAAIDLTLMKIEEVSPYEVLETVTLTKLSPFVSISSITDLIDVVAAYYPVTDTHEYWKNKRNVTRFANQIRIEMDARPSGASESAYLECEKRHTLTELTSTLRPDHEKALVLGAAARVARSHARPSINRQNIGGGRVPSSLMTWAELEERKFQEVLASFPRKASSVYEVHSRD